MGAASSLRHALDRQPDDGVAPKHPPRDLDRHVGLPDMDAVGAHRQRDVDAVVDHQRHAERLERCLDGARPLQHHAGIALLVPQLDQRRAAFGQHPRQVGEVVAAGTLRIDNGIEPHVHCRHVTLPRLRKVSWSRP